MKLYTFPFAPNPTKVMLYIAEREEAGGVAQTKTPACPGVVAHVEPPGGRTRVGVGWEGSSGSRNPAPTERSGYV